MTNADYVAIAVSPALIMALVGSLVFFLIEVLYVGQYQARLIYVFSLFVFAAVLIGRISIEMGSDRAALFALPLGVAMFLVLARFVEHASPYSHLINLSLLGIIWWSAHKLTWDCTLIDDSEDASGEGLMQHVGVDEIANENGSATSTADNELLGDQRTKKKRAHAPGLWVLYFSLAALPLFGIGQKWIPAADVGRRQYAFGLLAVYVAAGLTLLVTTSFLGLRRYLRQRRVEMPTPMAATWVVTGAALIGVVMLLAALIPRPQAEYAISQVPWQVESPTDLNSSRTSVGNDGTEDGEADEGSRQVVGDETDADSAAQREGDDPTSSSDEGDQQSSGGDGRSTEDSDVESTDGSDSDSGSASDGSNDPSEGSDGESDSSERQSGSSDSKSSDAESGSPAETASDESVDGEENPEEPQVAASESNSTTNNTLAPPPETTPPTAVPNLLPKLGGLAGLVKLIVYALLALLVLWLAWRSRQQIAKAIADIIQQIRDFLSALFGGKSKALDGKGEGEAERIAAAPPRPFASFSDPFASGQHRTLPPNEMVRYTYEAFEAWSREQGTPRKPDMTPAELVQQAVPRESPMRAEATRLVRLYNEAAYAPQAVAPGAVKKLAHLWTLMRTTAETPVEPVS